MPFKDKAVSREWYAARRRRIRSIIEEAKDRPCCDCHVRYPVYVMQFDHVRGIKQLNIGGATAQVKSLSALRDEIAKCEVVCANCHAARTFLRRVPGNGAQLGLNPRAS